MDALEPTYSHKGYNIGKDYNLLQINMLTTVEYVNSKISK